MKKLNYAGPSITSLEIKYVNEAVRHGFYENYKFFNEKHRIYLNFIRFS